MKQLAEILSSTPKRIVFLTLILFIFVISSCGPIVKNPTPTAQAEIPKAIYPQEEYRIKPGDLLDIQFYHNPELNDKVQVRPDGKIYLQLVNEITVTGMTPTKLSEVLTGKYSTELKNPKITIIVRYFDSKNIYILGKVVRPQPMPLLFERVSVMQAIAHAGGFQENATISEVVIIRRQAEQSPQVITVNLEKVIDGTDTSQDLWLIPADIVYVP